MMRKLGAKRITAAVGLALLCSGAPWIRSDAQTAIANHWKIVPPEALATIEKAADAEAAEHSR